MDVCDWRRGSDGAGTAGGERSSDQRGSARRARGRERAGRDPRLRLPRGPVAALPQRRGPADRGRLHVPPRRSPRRCAVSRPRSTGRVVVASVEEREKAFEEYDDALAAGHGAYLLDEERADVFTASVGNMPPGGRPVRASRPWRSCPSRATTSASPADDDLAPLRAGDGPEGRGASPRPTVEPSARVDVPYGLELGVDPGDHGPVRASSRPRTPCA